MNAGRYKIYAIFDEGKCRYYNFEPNFSFDEDGNQVYVYVYALIKEVIITKATLNISLSSVEYTYGSVFITPESALTAKGIETLNSDEYTIGVYTQEEGGDKVELNYVTDAGTYYIRLELSEDMGENYLVEQSVYVATYKILPRKISYYELIVQGVLRENGSSLKDRINVKFDESQFVDGIIPEGYELVFTNNKGEILEDVVTQGIYNVNVVFTNGNYEVLLTTSFTVYEPQSYKNLIIIAIVILLAVGGTIAVFISIKISRKKTKTHIQKQQIKQVNAQIEKGQAKQNNANLDNNNNNQNS